MFLKREYAALEGGVASLAVSSGHAAQFIALTTIMKNGENFITSPFLYGGTHNQFKVTFANLGLMQDLQKILIRLPLKNLSIARQKQFMLRQ